MKKKRLCDQMTLKEYFQRYWKLLLTQWGKAFGFFLLLGLVAGSPLSWGWFLFNIALFSGGITLFALLVAFYRPDIIYGDVYTNKEGD